MAGISVGSAELTRLAAARFGKLTEAEAKLLDAASGGTKAQCGPTLEDQDPANDPAQGEKWGAERVVRAELIRWLCLEKQPSGLVDARGLNLFGAKILGKLDLSYGNVPFPVSFERCRLMDDADLMSVKIPELNLLVSQTRALVLENAEIKGNLIIKLTVVEGDVRLLAAQIGSTLNCHGSTFSNPVRNNCQPGPDESCGKALRGDRMRVSGGVLLRDGFTANGEVMLSFACDLRFP